ncbi:MAG: hypothetical protein HZB70_01140 [Candidatus Berkelbacteria bacterium]|nr:MAG: hypothetical protein HZB70_01140 [Candidatus Berkelbacteria bacterium]QQG52056.1 MAG: hypothetical protein HY845_01855 [Candidatus Berkelbacteria bacterium]
MSSGSVPQSGQSKSNRPNDYQSLGGAGNFFLEPDEVYGTAPDYASYLKVIGLILGESGIVYGLYRFGSPLALVVLVAIIFLAILAYGVNRVLFE